MKFFFREIKFRGKFLREVKNAIISIAYPIKADNGVHAQEILIQISSGLIAHTRTVQTRTITWPRTLPKIFAINFDRAGIKYVLVIKRGRTIPGECLAAEVSRLVTAWNFILLCQNLGARHYQMASSARARIHRLV